MGDNGHLPDVKPNPPQWALQAGLPGPTETETLHDYCRRLGIDYLKLTAGLEPRTITNVHIRLVNVLAERCPDVWHKHLDEFVGKHKPTPKPRALPPPFRY